MNTKELQTIIDVAWEQRSEISSATDGPVRVAVEKVLTDLDAGHMRVAEKTGSGWQVNQWLKKAVLLSFRLNSSVLMSGGPEHSFWWDKVPSKFANWNESHFAKAGFRAVPDCVVRHSAYIAPDVVLMPSFINVGAYVGAGTMVDIYSTIGSCAQIGSHCHISADVMIGGVLEPLQANPVIIEDNCFIGASSAIAEGVIVEEGSVISMGVFIGASTKIIDRNTGQTFKGRIPAYSVVVAGNLPGKPLPNGDAGPSLACAVIVKRVDEQTRSKTSVNELLRD